LSTLTETDLLLDELRRADKLLLSTHEHPDGDALGSLLGMHHVLRALGKDSVMLLAPADVPVPPEYRQMRLEELTTAPPADALERLVVLLDCGNIDRAPIDSVRPAGVRILNVDHHHDNTRFGAVNLVRPEASCTAQIVFELARELGVELTPEIAEPLYIGLVTDTGRFSQENVTAEAHHMAADLIDAGVEVDAVSRSLYQELPYARLLLLQHALANIHRLCEDRITATVLTHEDFDAAGAIETDAEGIVDYLRTVEGTAVAALIRDRLDLPDGEMRKVSLRANSALVDVSRVARGMGGGGHRRAAGFTSSLAVPEIFERLCREVLEQLAGGVGEPD
jgi:phosphoesterase RecJ-like protein